MTVIFTFCVMHFHISRKFVTFSVDMFDTFYGSRQFDTFSVDTLDTFNGPTFDTFGVVTFSGNDTFSGSTDIVTVTPC